MPGEQDKDFSSLIVPRRATVVPRARISNAGVSLPLEKCILQILNSGSSGAIYIDALPGEGKTTAMQHLAAVLPSDRSYSLSDGPIDPRAFDHPKPHVIISTHRAPQWEVTELCAFLLAPWTEDDCMEYLAARHRAHLPRVLEMIKRLNIVARLDGSPKLLTMIIDDLAGDPSIKSVSDALRRRASVLYPPEPLRTQLAIRLAKAIFIDRQPGAAWLDETEPARLLQRYRTLQLLLAADRVAERLSPGGENAWLAGKPDRELVAWLSDSIQALGKGLSLLEDLLEQGSSWTIPTIVSLILTIDPVWRPPARKRFKLSGALLNGVSWSAVDLTDATLQRAQASKADLADAILKRIDAQGANFASATLGHAHLQRANLRDAVLTAANLRYANARGVDFSNADLEHANLAHARLARAKFDGANLKSADLCHSNLRDASLVDTNISDANFSGADLASASLAHLALSSAKLDGTSFASARIFGCHLEGIQLPAARFERAELICCYFTDAVMPGANFRGATFRSCGLADANWEDADLREVNFHHSTFHMGSSRSGLVGSTIPCEGSKTGFYTDDYLDQDHKPPEEIRKANLCGADLRGAKVNETDWYLVDLRGAKYDADQARHFARCGAILHSRSR